MSTNAAENITREYLPLPTTREERGRQIAQMGGIKPVGQKYKVPSQSGGSSGYIVDIVDDACSCLDYEIRRNAKGRCKHQEAVWFWLAWGCEVSADGSVTETMVVKRKTYPRDWSSYTAAQCNEGIYVERLLRALCDGIEEPVRQPSRRGRKPISLKNRVIQSVLKVYAGKSQSRAQSDVADSVAKGTLDRVFHRNTACEFFAEESATELLVSLIEESAKPLAALENGQFAIDSTGFSTVTYDRYFSCKHEGVASRGKWVKLHICVGTATRAITAVKVTSEGDCPQLPELTERTMQGFDVREMSADKAYSSKENHDALEKFGVEAFIPFRINAVIDPKRPAWSRALSEFIFNPDKFLAHYHRRSIVETVNSMIKRKLGAAVRSKLPTTQINEVLAKCLLHNLACLVQAIFSAGLAPKFWQDAAPAMPASRPALTLVP